MSEILMTYPVTLGFGELLQCLVAIKLVKKHIPDANITFAVPDRTNPLLNELTGVKLIRGLSETSSLKYLLENAGNRLKRSIKKNSKLCKLSKDPYANKMPPSYLSYFWNKYYSSSLSIEYLGPLIAKIMLRKRFDASAVCGHTLENISFFDYVRNYVTQYALTNGLTITFPISISKIWWHKSRETILQHLFKKYLDFVFVRGLYSRYIIEHYIENKKVIIAPDSGFGIRLLYGCPTKTSQSDIKVAIIPRKDYFFLYKKYDYYKLYLNSLIKAIQWLIQEIGGRIYLTPQTLKVYPLDDVSAINDLLKLLKQKNLHKYVSVLRPKSPIENYKLLSSMNLVITSRMHGGIMALSNGVPSLFLAPSDDVKIYDVLSSIYLNPHDFLVDIFNHNELKFEYLKSRISALINHGSYYEDIISKNIKNILPKVDIPAKVLAKSLA